MAARKTIRLRPVPETLAGIVVFHPDEAELAALVSRVGPDVAEVVIYANSPIGTAQEAALVAAARPAGLAVLRPPGNLGLGVAYDAFLERARARGAAHVFVLDQDSLPSPGTVPRLAALKAELAEAGGRPAVIGPRPLDPAGQPMKIKPIVPRTAIRPDATETAFVISSGSLVDVAAAADIGAFRADYFIDAIDIEWCLRARARGYSIWVAETVTMDHRLGRGVIRLPLGILLADQPPRRLYTYIRNQIAMMRLAHVPASHKVAVALSLPVRIAVYLVRNGFSRACWAALTNGILDGVRNRLGPPDDALVPFWRRGRRPE